jgi:hypothetical protein
MQHVNQQEPTRRMMLRAGAAAGTAAALGAGLFATGAARAATTAGKGTRGLPYPPDVTDTSHCTPGAAALFRGFFAAKSRHDLTALMSYFSATNVTYIDASLGISLTSRAEVDATFGSAFTTAPASAISYPLRIVGGTGSAAIDLVDTPDFFVPQELRALSAVTLDSRGKIVRWVDYWDGRSALIPNTITSSYPADFKDSEQNADPAIVQAAARLQAAFAAGDAAAAVALMSYDVVHEDMAARTRIRGQLQAQRYYTRALGQLPYGPGATLVHTDGSSRGGGYEWSASPGAAPLRRGHTCIELDEAGKVSRLTAIYDSSILSYAAYQSLVGAAAEAPLS